MDFSKPFCKWTFAKFAIVSLGIFVGLHLAFINLPPCGNHLWRQSNSLALTRNFFEENMSIWLPRVDKRWEFSGVTGTNFPLYEWILAVLYKIFGFSHTLHRIYALAISIASFMAIYRLFKLPNETTGRIVAFVFLFNPLIFYYGFSAMPDMLAILLIILANIQLYHLFQRITWQAFIMAFLFASLGLMIKYSFVLWLTIPFLLQANKITPNSFLKISSPILLALIPTYAWYRYATFLTANSGGLAEFIFTPRLLQKELLFDFFEKTVLSTAPELFFGFPLLVLIIWMLIKYPWYKHWNWIKTASVILFITYIIAASSNLLNHDYYLLPLLAPVLLLVSKLQILCFQNKVTITKMMFKTIFILLILMPIWAFFRTAPANWIGEDPEKFAIERQKISKINTANKRVICGVDETGCYLFYMLHQKGFPYYFKNELFTPREGKTVVYIKEAINNGAAFLVTNQVSDLDNPLLKSVAKEPQQLGKNLWIIPLIEQ